MHGGAPRWAPRCLALMSVAHQRGRRHPASLRPPYSLCYGSLSFGRCIRY